MGHSQLDRIEQKIDRVLNIGRALLGLSFDEEVKLMTLQEQIDAISASVNELPAIDDSLEALFAQLAQLIQQGQSGSSAALDTALAVLTTQKDRIKADIVANTPAAP